MKLISIGVLAGVALAGCMNSTTPEAHQQIFNADSGKQMTLPVGHEVDLVLQTIGPGQYGDPILSSDAMELLGVSFQGPPNPGGPRQLYQFTAVKPGSTEIRIPHTVQPTVFDLVIVVDP